MNGERRGRNIPWLKVARFQKEIAARTERSFFSLNGGVSEHLIYSGVLPQFLLAKWGVRLALEVDGTAFHDGGNMADQARDATASENEWYKAAYYGRLGARRDGGGRRGAADDRLVGDSQIKLRSITKKKAMIFEPPWIPRVLFNRN